MRRPLQIPTLALRPLHWSAASSNLCSAARHTPLIWEEIHCNRRFANGTKTCTPGRQCRHYWHSSSLPAEPSVDLCTQQLETDTTRTKRITVGNLESTLTFHPDTWRRARRVDFDSVSCRVGEDRAMAYHFLRGRLWVIAIQFRCTSKSVDLYAGTNNRRSAAKAARIRYSGVIKVGVKLPIASQ